jgi:transcription elongation factor Elf1
MSVVCLDCGNIIDEQALKIHQLTEHCIKVRLLNEKCVISCKQCGLRFMKHWHAESHHCNVYSDIHSDLQFRCSVLEKILLHAGINPNIDWEEVKKGKLDMKDFFPKLKLNLPIAPDICETKQENINKQENVILKNSPQKNLSITESSNQLNGQNLKAKKIAHLLESYSKAIYQNVSENEDGENYIYLLGSTMVEYLENQYFFTEETNVLMYLSIFQDLIKKKIRNGHESREQFINGIFDSISEHNWTSYLLCFFEIFDKNYPLKEWPIWKPSSDPLTIDQICQQFTLTYALKPLNIFIREILVGKYVFSQDQYYRFDPSLKKWILDPWMLHLTSALSNRILDVCNSLFTKAYKCCFGTNTFNKKWNLDEYMKPFVQVLKNAELASTVFEVGHLLRNELKISITNEQIIPQRPLMNEINDFAMLSTRIHCGIPGVEMINLYEIIFDNCDPEVSQQYIIKYVKGLSKYNSEYKPSIRFLEMVKNETQQYRYD